jgi:hydrogenase maturation factor HypF (carbamoyltransferase family)
MYLLTLNFIHMKNLAKQIKNVRKNATERNVSLFAEAVDKTIAEQIRLKKGEIADLEAELKETKDEALFDFQDSLVQINDSAIKSSTERKAYAENYIIDALGDFQDIVDKEDSLKAEIKDLKEQIKKLETIQGILDKLEIPVEKED